MTVVEIATVGEAGAHWTPVGWTALLLDDAPQLVHTFLPDADREPTPWRLQQVAGQLTRAVPSLASALTSPGMPTTLRTAVRAAADGHEARGLLKVLSRYRLLELVAAHAGRDDPWQVGETTAAQWPMAFWRRDASFAVGVALQAARAAGPDGRDRSAGVRTVTDGAGRFTDDLMVVADRCDELAATADGWLARWIREPIAAVDDSGLLTSILAGYRQDRTLLRGRFQRLRAAFVHGNLVDATVAASVDDFARFVGHSALALPGFDQGRCVEVGDVHDQVGALPWAAGAEVESLPFDVPDQAGVCGVGMTAVACGHPRHRDREGHL